MLRHGTAFKKTRNRIRIDSEILVHVGVDTVKLDGQHFVSHIKEGDRVNAGDLPFDIAQIKAAGYATVTPIIRRTLLITSKRSRLKQRERLMPKILLSLYGTK